MLSWVENEHIEYGLKIRRVSYILLKEKFEVVNVKTDWPQSPTTFRFEGVIKTLPKYGKKNHTHWLHWLIRLNLNKLCDIDYLDSVFFIGWNHSFYMSENETGIHTPKEFDSYKCKYKMQVVSISYVSLALINQLDGTKLCARCSLIVFVFVN